MNPFLSIIMPIYNGEKYLSEAIDSIIGQPCHDWELIMIIDGTKDGSEKICEEYSQRYENITYLYQENHGTGFTRNRGILLAHGDAIIFLDQDDKILKGFYTDEMRAFIKRLFDNGYDMIAPARLTGDIEMKKIEMTRVVEEQLSLEGYKACWKSKFELFTNIYSSYLFKEKNLKFMEYKVDMESLFTHSALYLSRKVLFTNKVFFSLRRQNPESVSHTWKYVNVLPIKIDAWADIVRWHSTVHSSDKDVIIESKKRYMRALSEMISLYCESSNDFDKLDRMIKDRKDFEEICNASDLPPEQFEVLRNYQKNKKVFAFKTWIKCSAIRPLRKAKRWLKGTTKGKFHDEDYWSALLSNEMNALLADKIMGGV